MATCEITVEIPAELAQSLSLKVPAEEQSRFVAEAVRRSLISKLSLEERARRDAIFEMACDALDGNPDLELLDREMDALDDDPIEEPSHVSEAR